MISKYIKEQKKYTRDELRTIFETKEEKELVRIIKRLKEYGVLNAVKKDDSKKDLSELMEQDVLVVDEEEKDDIKHYYVFKFVGIIIVEGIVLKCYPKYIQKNKEPFDELCQIIKVLRRFNSKEQVVNTYSTIGSEKSKFDRLAAIVFLLNDYFEYGVYSNEKNTYETNGAGEILWDKTVTSIYPVIKNGKPYYFEYYSRKNQTDEYDVIKRIYECVITMCNKELHEADLLEVFEFQDVFLTDETLEDIGEKDYILYCIGLEKNVQFNTRKQLVLDVIEHLILDSGYLEEKSDVSVFGTGCFNLIWEGVCKEVFDDQLDSRLEDIESRFFVNKKVLLPEEKGLKLKQIIEKPFWTRANDNGIKFSAYAKDTLIPDIVTFGENDYKFYILDAKYYVPDFSIKKNKDEDETKASISDQPGIESVVKQYMYLFAFLSYIKKYDIQIGNVYNCFVLPQPDDYIEVKDEVRLNIIHDINTEKTIPSVKARYISPNRVFSCYLSSKKLSIDELKL